MGSTSVSIHRTTGNVATAQGYAPSTDLYKPIAVREIGSSEYGQEVIPYVITSSSGFYPWKGDTGGRAYVLSAGESTTKTVTVSTSTDGLSDAVNIGGYRIAAIQMSTAWTTANITFAAAASTSASYDSLYDDLGNEVTVTSPAASRTVALDTIGGSLAAVSHVKFRSGTAGTPVTQAAARTLTLILKG